MIFSLRRRATLSDRTSKSWLWSSEKNAHHPGFFPDWVLIILIYFNQENTSQVRYLVASRRQLPTFADEVITGSCAEGADCGQGVVRFIWSAMSG
jgi:hypothetical protein